MLTLLGKLLHTLEQLTWLLGSLWRQNQCGVGVSSSLRVLRDVDHATFLHDCEIQDVCWKCILSQNHSRADTCPPAASAVQRGKPPVSPGELQGSSSKGLSVCHQDDPCSPSHHPSHELSINKETNLAQHLFWVPLKYWKVYQQAVWRCYLKGTRRWWKIFLWTEMSRRPPKTKDSLAILLMWLHSEMSDCDKKCLWK